MFVQVLRTQGNMTESNKLNLSSCAHRHKHNTRVSARKVGLIRQPLCLSFQAVYCLRLTEPVVKLHCGASPPAPSLRVSVKPCRPRPSPRVVMHVVKASMGIQIRI